MCSVPSGRSRDQLEPPRQVRDRLEVGRSFARPLTGSVPVGNGARTQSRLGVVMGEKVGAALREAGEPLLQDLRDIFVPSGATLLQKRLIRDLLGQRVLEGVLEVGRRAGLVQEFGRLERRETATQVVDRAVDDGLENGEGHVPPNHRGGLEEILLILGEPVDPGGENRLDRDRDLDRRD